MWEQFAKELNARIQSESRYTCEYVLGYQGGERAFIACFQLTWSILGVNVCINGLFERKLCVYELIDEQRLEVSLSVVVFSSFD